MKNKLPNGVKAALIDMDGVLYDSMPHHAKAWYGMFSELGFNVDPDEFYLYEGMTGGTTIDMIFKRELGRGATEEEQLRLYDRKAELFVNSGEKVKMKGADRMLKALKRGGVKTVLVTGSAQESLIDSLAEDYPGYFPKYRSVTALDVKNGKPHPEPYLKGLQKAEEEKENVIVVENAPLGVRAGKAAGLFTIAVTTGPIPKEEFEKEGADMIFPDMEAFADWLEENLQPNPARELDLIVETMGDDRLIVVTDKNVDNQVFPLLTDSKVLTASPRVVIPPGEDNKNLKSVEKIWEKLEETGATRNSLIVNVGGGLITDLGGFAAATFKRGIRFINFPTTLLGAVDAATGGKTGINFRGLKNEIGAFHQPEAVVISSLPFRTLPERDWLSGYAEMIKTALIADKRLYLEIFDVEKLLKNPRLLEKALKQCVKIKESVVAADPKENGLRKILNFGHTAGHAFESLSFETGADLTHGEAVAHGMLVELILSHLVLGFDTKEVPQYANEILKPFYPKAPMACKDLPRVLQLMTHDKKNRSNSKVNFTLLKEIGEPEINREPPVEEIQAALDIYCDMMN